MHRRFLAFFLSGAALLAGASDAFASHSLSFSSHGSISSCDDFQFNEYNSYDRGAAIARAQEERTVAAGTALQVTAFRNGGVSIIGWDKAETQVLVCKAAAADTQAEADGLLKLLHANIAGGVISGGGPENDQETWMYFIVHVPNGANVTARATNGPVEVRHANGTFDLQTQNGPIALGGVSGTIKARAQNGPIAFTGSSGDVELTTVNGPIAVSFDQKQWQGRGLSAHVQNGPLSIAVPNDYASGVEIRTSGHAPIVCSSCELTQDYTGQTIHLGAKDAPVLVRLSTVNGPVNIAGPRMF
jgi:hypothetical protein